MHLLKAVSKLLLERGSPNYDLFKEFYVYELLYSSLSKLPQTETNEDWCKDVLDKFPNLLQAIEMILCNVYQEWLKERLPRHERFPNDIRLNAFMYLQNNGAKLEYDPVRNALLFCLPRIDVGLFRIPFTGHVLAVMVMEMCQEAKENGNTFQYICSNFEVEGNQVFWKSPKIDITKDVVRLMKDYKKYIDKQSETKKLQLKKMRIPAYPKALTIFKWCLSEEGRKKFHLWKATDVEEDLRAQEMLHPRFMWAAPLYIIMTLLYQYDDTQTLESKLIQYSLLSRNKPYQTLKPKSESDLERVLYALVNYLSEPPSNIKERVSRVSLALNVAHSGGLMANHAEITNEELTKLSNLDVKIKSDFSGNLDMHQLEYYYHNWKDLWESKRKDLNTLVSKS